MSPVPAVLTATVNLGHMLPDMWRVFGGAVLVIAGIAAFIEAHAHHPVDATPGFQGSPLQALQLRRAGVNLEPTPASCLSHTAYDLLRIGA